MEERTIVLLIIGGGGGGGGLVAYMHPFAYMISAQKVLFRILFITGFEHFLYTNSVINLIGTLRSLLLY